MKVCARRLEGGCAGRITWEHTLIYAGKQVQEEFAIIGLCEEHHLRAGMDKEKNQAIAFAQATVADLEKYPKSDWLRRSQYLLDKYDKLLPIWYPQGIGRGFAKSAKEWRTR